MKRLVSALSLSALAAAASCASTKASLPTNLGASATPPPPPIPNLVRPETSVPLGVDEHVILTLEGGASERTVGPFLARRGDALMAAYIGGAEGGARRVVSVPMQPTGEARSDARVVAEVSADATSLVVRPSGGERAGFVLAWTSLTDRGKALSIASVADDGRPRTGVLELARTGDDIVWIEIVPTARGAIVVWAEETRGGDANVLAAALGSDGALRSLPNRIARGVTGWQMVATDEGAALALSAAGTRGKKAGALTWLRLDADARPVAPAITVASPQAMSGDVDVARVAGGYVLAWTDHADPDPQVMLASVDDAGHVHGPRRAVEDSAGASLVGIVGGPAGAMLAWDEPFKRGRAARRVYFARVDASPSADVGGATVLELQGRGAPELVATPDGFAVLAPARACPLKWEGVCADAPVIPTLVRFDARLAVTQVEPLRLGPVREASTMGWGLTCAGDRCVALAATGETPTRVHAADLKMRATAFRAPLVAPPLPDAPHVTAVTTLASGAFADVAATRVGTSTLLALLTAAVDEPLKKGDAHGATLSVRAVGARPGAAASAAAAEKIQPLSTRALTVGGVAIAGAGRVEDGAAVAWVAPEAGDPQLHVTRVDARGRRMNDVQVTTSRGDASDVAIAWVGDGWIVAWVDGRDGNGEVYATKLDRDLRRVAREERITRAPGDASDVTLLARPDGAWLAWADPRESPSEGFADIYVAPLRGSDATLAGEESRVLGTAAHSRSPSLGATGDQLAVAWIEEAPMGADPSTSPSYGAMLAWLDPRGRPVREPGHLATGGAGFPTAVTLDGTPTSLHVVLARSAHDSVELDGIEITRAPSPRAYPLVGLDGPPSLDVAVALLGDAVFFNDEGQDAGDRRARRATVQWRH